MNRVFEDRRIFSMLHEHGFFDGDSIDFIDKRGKKIEHKHWFMIPEVEYFVLDLNFF
jgi:hypothetical protein